MNPPAQAHVRPPLCTWRDETLRYRCGLDAPARGEAQGDRRDRADRLDQPEIDSLISLIVEPEPGAGSRMLRWKNEVSHPATVIGISQR